MRRTLIIFCLLCFPVAVLAATPSTFEAATDNAPPAPAPTPTPTPTPEAAPAAPTVTSQDEQTAFTDALRFDAEKDWNRARRLFEKLTSQFPNNALYWFNLASVAHNQADYRAAIAGFRKVVAFESDLAPAAKFGLIKCYRKLDLVDVAMVTFLDLKRSSAGAEMATELESEQTYLSGRVTDLAWDRYDHRDYRAALQRFQQAARFSDDPNLRLMIGMTYMRLGRSEDAKHFLNLALSQTVDAAVSTDARYFLQRLQDRRASSLWLVLEAGVGYDSNVFLEGDSDPREAHLATQLGISGGYLFLNQKPWTARALYALNWEETPGLPEGRFISQTLREQTSYDLGSFAARLSPFVQYQILGTAPYLLKPGLTASVEGRARPFNFGLQYEYTQNYAQIPSYLYLDGHIHWLKGWLGYALPRFEAGAFYLWIQEGTSDLAVEDAVVPIHNTAQGPGVRVAVWPLLSWELEATFTTLWRQYPTLAEPGEITRKDTEYLLAFSSSLELQRGLRLFLTVSEIINRSTLDASSGIVDENYHQLVGFAGLAWDILK